MQEPFEENPSMLPQGEDTTSRAVEAIKRTEEAINHAAEVIRRTEDVISSFENEDTNNTSRNSLQHIILGLLWTHPMSGYDIKQAFDRALASYWNAGSSQIYTALKSLSQAGLVESEIIVQTARPNRKVYRLTQAGKVKLDCWLQEAVPERFTKDEFLTKLFFCGETTDRMTLMHLRQHRDNLLKQLEHMEWVRQQYGSRPARRPRLLEYQMLVREYKEAVLKAGLEVTEKAIARLESREDL